MPYTTQASIDDAVKRFVGRSQYTLQEREGVSGQLKKLKSYFVAKGVDLSGTTAREPGSHIFVGGVLD